MAAIEGYVQVAADGAGKKIRNRAVDVLQADGTTITVYQQEVTRVASDGTILDTIGWVETAQEMYVRSLAEQMLDAIQTLSANLGGPFSLPSYLTVIPGE